MNVTSLSVILRAAAVVVFDWMFFRVNSGSGSLHLNERGSPLAGRAREE
jgi:hypothetical protein